MKADKQKDVTRIIKRKKWCTKAGCYWKGVEGGCARYGQSPNQTKSRRKRAKGELSQSAVKTAGKKAVWLLKDDDLDTGEELPINALQSWPTKTHPNKLRATWLTPQLASHELHWPLYSRLHASTSPLLTHRNALSGCLSLRAWHICLLLGSALTQPHYPCTTGYIHILEQLVSLRVMLKLWIIGVKGWRAETSTCQLDASDENLPVGRQLCSHHNQA